MTLAVIYIDCSGFTSYQETDSPLDFRKVESYP